MKKIIITISGPSGSGKNTILNEILKQTKFVQTPHATTRQPRGENDNEYIFLTKEEFLDRVETGEIMEYTQIADNYYGTCTPHEINNIMIFDHVGVEFIKEYAPQNGFELVTIFLDVNIEQCQQRMLSRGDNPEVLQKRFENDKTLISECKRLCQFHVNAFNPVEQVIADTLEIINRHCK